MPHAYHQLLKYRNQPAKAIAAATSQSMGYRHMKSLGL
jgi:hypothetical protein